VHAPRRRAGEVAGINHQSLLQTGTARSREVSARVGVTNDEAENAPRLRVLYGEDSRESKPPNGVPSQDTPRQGLSYLDPGSLAMAFSRSENQGGPLDRRAQVDRCNLLRSATPKYVFERVGG
jgi:hypothetical protein